MNGFINNVSILLVFEILYYTCIYYFYAICRSDTGFVCKSLKCTVKAWKKTYVINESMKKTHICALFIRSHAWFNTSLSFVYICVQVLIPLTLSFSILYIASKCQGGLAYCWLVLITLIYKYADCVATLFICAKIEYCYIQ